MANGRRGAGEGSVTQLPDGRWMSRLDLGYINGKRVRKAYFGKTRAEATTKLYNAIAEHQKGLPVAIPKQTMSQFLTRWLAESVDPTVRPRTTKRYEELTRLHILPTLGRTTLMKLTPQDL
jgi:hypothetical protein